MDQTLPLAHQHLQQLVTLRVWTALCVGALSRFSELALFALDGSATSVITPSARVIAAATLAIYNFDATVDALRAGRRGTGVTVAWVTAAAGALWLVFELRPLRLRLAGLVALGALPCLLYAVRGPYRGRVVHLKALPGVKAPFVGSAVALACVLVPTFARGASVWSWPSLDSALLTVALICFCTANANLFDFPDRALDHEHGIPTAPVLWGIRGAKLWGLGWTLTGILAATLCADPRVRWPLWSLGAALLVAHTWVGAMTKKASLAWWVDASLALPLIVRTILA